MMVDLVRCPELMVLYRSMEGQERAYPEGEHEERMAIPTPQKSLYSNDDVYGMMLHFQYRWYGTGCRDDFQRDLRDAVADAFEQDVIETFRQGGLSRFKRCALEILYTRPERWRQLARYFGLAGVPEGFTVFRATDWSDAVTAVLRVWEAELDLARVPHAGLSSWSLLEGDERSGAVTHLHQHPNGVIVVADVPIEDTFMDVLVDDGYFARHGIRECEIIVGTGDQDLEVLGYPKRCVVRIEGVDYRYSERDDALRHARRTGLVPRR